MNKTLIGILVLIVAAAGAWFFFVKDKDPQTAGTTSAQEEPVLRIYNWSDYIAEDTVQKFEEATGIKVTYDVYDANETLDSKLLTGNSGYDIVVPTSFPFLDRQIKAGAYQKLDKSQIPNYANLDPELMQSVAAADPNNEHAVIWMWGTNGIGVNVQEVEKRMPDAPIDSLDIIFKPEVVSKFKDCGVSLLDSPTDMIPTALNYLGLDPTSTSPDDLQKAKELLMSVRPYIKYFNSSQYINDLANGEICIAFGYSGDIIMASDRAEEAENGIEIQYSIPNEGTLIWFDTMAIPKDAPHPGNAHKWINFVLQPEIQAANTNYVSYANPVPASLPMVDEGIKEDPSIYPTPEVMDRLFTVETKSDEFVRLQSRAWTEIRTGQ